MNRMRIMWTERRYLIRKRYERALRWIVWRLPREAVTR